jgi:hypothetical protein
MIRPRDLHALTIVRRCCTAGIALVLVTACVEYAPLAPVDQPPDQPAVPAEMPAPRRPALVYQLVGEHGSPTGGHSRYVLFEDGTFDLYFVTAARSAYPYHGRYTRADTVITLSFAVSTSWQAAGTLRADSLIVAYNVPASMDGFEDAVYVLTRDYFAQPGQIHVANADGSTPMSIARGSWPAWSPDGRTLAFHRAGHIYAIGVDGSGERALAAGGLPAWSPDGTRIVFTNATGIATIGVDGSGLTTLLRHDFRDDTYAPHDMGVGKPAWSPDYQLIAFEHFGDGVFQPAQIFVMNADGTEPRLVTAASNGRRYAESDPAWSPTGSSIAFWSFGYGIAVVAASGGEPRSAYFALPFVAYGARPGYSADEGTLVFTAGRFGPDGPSIWTVPTAGGQATLLIARGWDAVWSPDGARIAFVTHTD